MEPITRQIKQIPLQTALPHRQIQQMVQAIIWQLLVAILWLLLNLIKIIWDLHQTQPHLQQTQLQTRPTIQTQTIQTAQLQINF